jgi:hypothetical protein
MKIMLAVVVLMTKDVGTVVGVMRLLLHVMAEGAQGVHMRPVQHNNFRGSVERPMLRGMLLCCH